MDVTLREPAGVDEPARPALRPWQVIAVGAGNALEFYDFLTFSFFAIQIGRSFFPASATAHGLLFSLAAFGAGFLTRPLGGWIIGRFSDRRGRKPAMMLSFLLMGAAMVGLALTPAYDRIGPAAPLLLLGFRLVQGFALGGQVGPSTAFLIEAAPPARRGLYVGLQYATQDLAVLLAGIVGFVLANLLTPAALDAYGWRIAFLIGATIVPLGLILRRRLPETLEAGALAPAGSQRPRAPARLLALGAFMLAATAVANYVLEYMTTFAQDSLHMAANAAFGLTIVLGLFSMVCQVLGGLLTDVVGRKPVMVAAAGLMAALAVPAYAVMARAPSVAVIYAVMAALSVLNGFFSSPSLTALTEALPKAVRAGSLGTLYACVMAVLGATTQAAVKQLIDVTGSPLAPAWYLTAAMAAGLVAMLLMRETAPGKTGGV